MSGTAVNGSGEPLTMEPEGGITEESTIESTDAWKCKCGTVNDPEAEDLAEDADPDVCKNCGASAFDSDEDTPTIDDIKAGLETLSGGIATAQEVENAARAGEGLPPLERAGLLDFGPFNSDAALKAIFEKSAEVRELQADYERAKETAKDAKSELDIASKALVNIIESLKNRRTQALNPSQPYLADVGDQPASTACPWEVAHPGQHCPICVAAKQERLIPVVDSAVHPEHAGHSEIAEAARVKNVLEPLADKLRGVNVFVWPGDLADLTADELTALTSYADEPTPMPPHVVVRCCIAAEPGSILQVCQRCDRVLAEFAPGDEASAFPVGSFVSLACGAAVSFSDVLAEAADADTAAVLQSAEPTRTIKPRGSKKTAKKNPEQERVKQAEAGRRASDKKPSTKKAKSSKPSASRGKGTR